MTLLAELNDQRFPEHYSQDYFDALQELGALDNFETFLTVLRDDVHPRAVGPLIREVNVRNFGLNEGFCEQVQAFESAALDYMAGSHPTDGASRSPLEMAVLEKSQAGAVAAKAARTNARLDDAVAKIQSLEGLVSGVIQRGSAHGWARFQDQPSLADFDQASATLNELRQLMALHNAACRAREKAATARVDRQSPRLSQLGAGDPRILGSERLQLIHEEVKRQNAADPALPDRLDRIVTLSRRVSALTPRELAELAFAPDDKVTGRAAALREMQDLTSRWQEYVAASQYQGDQLRAVLSGEDEGLPSDARNRLLSRPRRNSADPSSVIEKFGRAFQTALFGASFEVRDADLPYEKGGSAPLQTVGIVRDAGQFLLGSALSDLQRMLETAELEPVNFQRSSTFVHELPGLT